MTLARAWWPRRAALGLVALLGLDLAGCALARSPLPWRRTCPDGWPIRILQDPRCPEGICGYTCAPDRWRAADAGDAPRVLGDGP